MAKTTVERTKKYSIELEILHWRTNRSVDLLWSLLLHTLSGGRRPLELFGSQQRVFFSLMTRSSEKFFLFYLTQADCPQQGGLFKRSQ